MCVRRCRSKLFDRGEVYWQPGKVHTCTTGIVSYRTSCPRGTAGFGEPRCGACPRCDEKVLSAKCPKLG